MKERVMGNVKSHLMEPRGIVLEKEKHLIQKRQGMIGEPEKIAMQKVAVNLTLLPRITTVGILKVVVRPDLLRMKDGMIVTSTVAVILDPPLKSVSMMSDHQVITLLTNLLTIVGWRIAIPPAMGKVVAVPEVMLAGMIHARRMQSLTLRQDCLTRSIRSIN